MGLGIENDIKEEINEVINKYALLIGVDRFNDKRISSLPGVTKDMEKFTKILEDTSFSRFKVTPLYNPSLIDARKAISTICHTAEENDVIFFYYSGYGTLDNARSFYLLYTDSEVNYKDATCMESEYILSQFRKSKCKNFIVIVDACHSGAFFNNNRGLPNGLVALTACDQDQSAEDTPDGGLFSNIIIEGLKSEYIDANRDGVITFSELFDFITAQVKEKMPYSTPKKWEWNVHKDIYLFDSPRLVFISYQRKQKNLVKKISEALKKSDINTFVDQEKLRIGDNWKKHLENNIKNCRAFIYIIDRGILNSEVANWELEVAHRHKVPILPVMVENVKMHAMFEKTYGSYNRMTFDHQDFDSSIKTISDHIKSIRVVPKKTRKKKIKVTTR